MVFKLFKPLQPQRLFYFLQPKCLRGLCVPERNPKYKNLRTLTCGLIKLFYNSILS